MFHEITRHLSRAAAALAVGLLALGAGPAMAQVTTIGDGITPLSPTTPITACPGGAAVRADYFTLQADQPGDWVKAVRLYLSPGDAVAALAQIEVRNSAGTITYGSVVPGGTTLDVQLATTFAVSTASPTEYSIWVTPKGFGAIPSSVANANIVTKVQLVFNRFLRAGSDTNGAPVRLDSQAPAEVGWTSLAVSTVAPQITLNWSPPADAQAVLVLRDTKPVVDAPVAPAAVTAYGAVGATFSGGTSSIRFAGTAAPWRVTDTVANGTYYYRAYARDACGNWSAGEAIGPIVVGGTTPEGDPTPNSIKPMVGILNPIPGGVVGRNFKVQARIYSPKNGATVQPITSATITVKRTDGTTAATGTLARNAQFGAATDSGVFEPSPVLSLAAGPYTLQVNAANAAGNANSAVVSFVVGAGAGDGNILRRDNSSQLCSDCHAIKTHSTEGTSNKYGAWYAGCRACHQPHGTPNASLVAVEVIPPQVATQLPPTKTYYATSTGYDPAAGATSSTTIAAATFANGDRTGPCQVCHTRTNFYRRTGTGGPANLAGGADHYTTTCTDCHKHTAGFGASCTSCHGTTGRTAAGADSLVAAAPPRDHLGNTLYTFTSVGAHQAHVTSSRFRAPLACAECHPIPNAHNGSTEVVFQSVDCNWGRGGVTCTPQSPWTTSTPNCSNLYCHGNFNNGGHANPQWTATPGSVSCGSCHAIPPPAPHSTSTACGSCHGSAYTTSTVDPVLHMNGVLDAAACNGCHGDPTRVSNWKSDPNNTIATTFTDAYVSYAPPADASTAHNTVTTARGVGAHQTHVNKPVAGALSYPYTCTTCHVSVPSDGTHGATYTTPNILAATGWTGTSCNNTCHSRTGAATPNPSWTTVNGSIQASCASCHASPPTTATNGHPNNQTCTTCHPAGYAITPSRTVAYATHADGVVQVNTSSGCARCHGVLENGMANTDLRVAPGYVSTTIGIDTHGNNLATVLTVGAHDAHVRPAGSLNATSPIGCANCHGTLPPTGTVTHANGTIDLGWSALASSTWTPATAQPQAFNAAFDTTPTCLVYCHSNASPVGGARSTTRSPGWNTTATLACNSCHAFQADAVLSGSSTNLSHGHYKHTAATTAGGYYFNCSECHNTVATGQAGNPAGGAIVAGGQANHVTGTHTVVFNAAMNPGTTGYNQAPNYTCANTYCHSNGTNAATPPTNTSLAWTGTVTCSSCHNAGAAMATGKHQNHVANAGVIGANVYCGDCHSSTVAAGTDAVMIGTGTTPTHVDRVKTVLVAARGGQTSGAYNNLSTNCASNYCHSTGQPGAARRNVTVNWTDTGWTGNICNKCHGSLTANAWGAPDYANGGQNTLTANSHAAHATGSDDCYACHRTTTASGTTILAGGAHLNGAIDVQFSTTMAGTNAQAGFTARAGNTSPSCRNISCHGNNATAVVWGGPSQTCRSCHFGASGAGNSDLDDYVYGNGTVAKIDPDDWGTFGHGAINNFVESVNTRSNFDNAGGAAVDGCLYCHDTAANGVSHGMSANPFRLKNTGFAEGKLGVCLVCHGSSGVNGGTKTVTVGGVGKTAATKIDSVHYGTGHTAHGTAGGLYCWDCHDAHGDYNYAAGQRLAYMIQLQPVMNHAATTTATDWGQPRSGADLAQTPDFRKNRSAGGNLTAWDWTDYVSSQGTTPYRGVCQVCHTPANTGHFNQTTSENAHPGGGICTSCHAHDQGPTDAFAGKGGDCLGCHGAAGAAGVGKTNNRRAVAADFSKTSHHVGSGSTNMGGTLTNRDCVVCHAEGTITAGATDTTSLHMNGKIDLRDADSAAGAYIQYDSTVIRALGTAAANSGNATWRQEMSGRGDDLVGAATVACSPTGTNCSKGLDRFCLSCHDADGASQSYVLGDSGATALNPFSDGRITNEYDIADRTRVTDIASRVDVTARNSSGVRVTATDRDFTVAPAGVIAVRTADGRTDPPEGVFARHAIRGLSTSVYAANNTNWDGTGTPTKGTSTTYWNRTNAAWSSTSVMSCADCHTSDGVNTTSGSAHGSNSQYMLKNATGSAVTGSSPAAYGCAQCHAAGNYLNGTHMGTSANTGNCFYDGTANTGANRMTGNGNVYGLPCTTCHGGGGASKASAPVPTGSSIAGGFGTIHGTSQVLGYGSGGGSAGTAYRPAYRFSNGNSMRYYDPGDWQTTANRTCITLGTGDSWGSCTQHSGTSRSNTVQTAAQRPLKY